MGGAAEDGFVSTNPSKQQPFHSKLQAFSTYKVSDYFFVPRRLVPRGRVQSASNLIFPGAVAQLGERLICIQEVAGSIPTSSTSLVESNLGL